MFTAQQGDAGELLAFTDADALRALDAIRSRRPAVVMVERAFASTPRGAALKPTQRVRLVLADPLGAVRCTAVVTWAALEVAPRGGSRYRAGLEFLDANPAAVAAYCSRQKAL